MRRSAMNQSFLFYDESPSYVSSSSSSFARVQLPHHVARQWEGYDQNVSTSIDVGGICTDFSSTPPVKLGNANMIDMHPQIEGFLKNLELSELQAAALLFNFKRVLHSATMQTHGMCVGTDEDCGHMFTQAACDWLHNNTDSWYEFMPEHAHCGVGTRVVVNELLESSFCELCEPGRFMNTSTYSFECYPCPAGQFVEEEGQRTCLECPVGTYGNETAATTYSACIGCEPGQFQDEDGETSCK
eukprot:SAG31_NODE_6148_length_2148_cov_1.273792_1_plen_242_part_10